MIPEARGHQSGRCVTNHYYLGEMETLLADWLDYSEMDLCRICAQDYCHGKFGHCSVQYDEDAR